MYWSCDKVGNCENLYIEAGAENKVDLLKQVKLDALV